MVASCGVVLAPTLVAQNRVEKPAASLEGLVHRTGWIYLGGITENRADWAVGADPDVPFLTGAYRIVDRDVDRRRPFLPAVGERIELTTATFVRILDFSISGEARRLDRPIEGWDARKDETGVRLDKGTVVKVCDLFVDEPAGTIRPVHARVCLDE